MDESLKLPKLPPVHRTQSALRCMACKKPYQPPLTTCANSVTLNWSCACGCGTFEGVLGYEPQPRYIAEQLRAHGLACARAALEEAAKLCAENGFRDEKDLGIVLRPHRGPFNHDGQRYATAIRNLKVGE